MATATVKDVRKIDRMPAYLDHDPLMTDVLDKAGKHFDYAAHDMTQRGPLGKALKELDIIPFDGEAVARYKASKERVYKTGHIAARGLITLFTPLIAGVTLLMLEVQKFHIRAESWLFVLTTALTALTTIIGIAIHASMVENNEITKQKHTWEWERWGLCNFYKTKYPRFIPVHVLNLANQIYEKVDGVIIGVDELTHKVENIANPVPDPFLWVQRGAEMYYIEAWDERDFRDNR